MTERSKPAFAPPTPGGLVQRQPNIPDHTLLRLIGKGSYGEVWLARNAIGTLRAVKVIFRSSFSENRPYERELAGIQKFEPVSRSHDGLIDILQVGRNDADNYFYYVMELADPNGSEPDYRPRTLQDDLARNGPMPLAVSLPIFLSLSSALGHLHRRGLVHRDIKPANVIFVKGLAKLADIGLVAEFCDAHSYVGTEGFIPPEGPGTTGADIYSLGKLLYEVSTGLDRNEFPRLPITPHNLEKHHDLLELNAVVLKACASDPKLRYQSADAMHAELALLQSGKSVRNARRLEIRLARLTKIAIASGAITVLALGASFLAEKRATEAEGEHRIEKALRSRAEAAEQRARDRLAEALLASARAERRSGQSGQRLKALEYITNAVTLLGPTAELRSEAVAALALSDFRRLRSVELGRRGLELLGSWPQADRVLYELTNGTYLVCRFVDGAEVARIQYQPSPKVRLAEVSPDGQILHLFWDHGETLLWNLQHPHEKPVRLPRDLRAGQFTADSRFLGATVAENKMAVFDVNAGVAMREFSVPSGISEFQTVRGSSLLAAVTKRDQAGQPREFTLIDTADGSVRRKCDMPGDAFVLSSALSDDGKWFAMGGSDFVVRIWPTDASAEQFDLGKHGAEVVAMAFHPDGQVLATSSWDGTTQVWDVATRKPLFSHGQWFLNLGFLPGAQLLAAEGEELHWELLELPTGTVCRQLIEREPQSNIDQSKGPWAVDYSRDGRWMSTASWDGVRIWSTEQGCETMFLPLGKSYSCLFLTQPKALLTTSETGARLWPFESDSIGFGEKILLNLPGPARAVGPAAADSTQRNVWLSTDHGLVEIVDGIARPAGHLPQFSGYFSASPDGRWLAGVADRELRVVNAQTGETACRLPVTRFSQATFAPDGKSMIAATATNIICWDLDRNREEWWVPWRNSGGGGGRVAVSPDSRWVAATLEPRIVALLERATGRLLTRLEHPEPQPISALAFSPDGNQLTVVTLAHRIQLWDLRRLQAELAALKLDWR